MLWYVSMHLLMDFWVGIDGLRDGIGRELWGVMGKRGTENVAVVGKDEGVGLKWKWKESRNEEERRGLGKWG